MSYFDFNPNVPEFIPDPNCTAAEEEPMFDFNAPEFIPSESLDYDDDAPIPGLADYCKALKARKARKEARKARKEARKARKEARKAARPTNKSLLKEVLITNFRGQDEFNLSDVYYKTESIIQKNSFKNNNIKATIRALLQSLRDEDLIIFSKRGVYKWAASN